MGQHSQKAPETAPTANKIKAPPQRQQKKRAPATTAINKCAPTTTAKKQRQRTTKNTLTVYWEGIEANEFQEAMSLIVSIVSGAWRHSRGQRGSFCVLCLLLAFVSAPYSRLDLLLLGLWASRCVQRAPRLSGISWGRMCEDLLEPQSSELVHACPWLQIPCAQA